MPFSGGSFSRLYSWVTDRTNGIKIRADRFDDELNGIAAGLSNTICKDGQTTITADIPFNNKKITGLADASADTHALNRQSGDARYLKRPSTLTAESNIADGDIIPFYDLSITADRGITYANLKSDILTEGQAAGSSFFPAGTVMLFLTASAPTGWTKATNSFYNNKALRLVTGTPSSGGSVDFTTAFASQTPSGTVGSTTLTEDQIPAHRHFEFAAAEGVNGTGSTLNNSSQVGENRAEGSGDQDSYAMGRSSTEATLGRSSPTGGGQSHTHSFTGNAINLAVAYVDVIVAEKN